MVERKKLKLLLFTFSIFISGIVFSQSFPFRFNKLLQDKPNQITTFCVPNDSATLSLLRSEKITLKYTTKTWAFISCTPSWIDEKIKSGQLKNFYFEFAPPMALADTALVRHHAYEVHQ